MTFEEFRIATADIEQFYEKSMNPTQVKIWYDELKNYSLERYKKAIKNVCKTSQYRPTLSVMLDALRNAKSDTQQKQKTECKACNGTGYVMYHKVIEGIDYEFAAQCNCSNAIGLDYDGSKIADKEHRSDYYLAKAADVFGVSK